MGGVTKPPLFYYEYYIKLYFKVGIGDFYS